MTWRATPSDLLVSSVHPWMNVTDYSVDHAGPTIAILAKGQTMLCCECVDCSCCLESVLLSAVVENFETLFLLASGLELMTESKTCLARGGGSRVSVAMRNGVSSAEPSPSCLCV